MKPINIQLPINLNKVLQVGISEFLRNDTYMSYIQLQMQWSNNHMPAVHTHIPLHNNNNKVKTCTQCTIRSTHAISAYLGLSD